MAYNLSLDLVALAIQESKKGNLVNAGVLFMGAVKDSSADKAMRMIQATNEHALKTEASKTTTKKAPAKTQASKAKVKASESFEKTDDATLAVLKKLAASEDGNPFAEDADEDIDDAEDDVEDAEDEVEDAEDEVEEASAKPVNARTQAAAFAAVLAKFSSNAKKAAPAKK
jgi:hypothetical protein